MIHFPETLTVQCDICAETKEFSVTEYAGDPVTVGIDDSSLKEEDWISIGSDHYCPNCKDEYDDED